ncbi:MAG: hypothetical protein K5785_00770 [Nitrosarchaeum sp.]|nr:hypothetical protein [Nitrosarchaeum sp.]
MSCKGLCDGIKALKPQNATRYSSGQRRCQRCCIFIQTSDLRCPCCNGKLRTKPRNAEPRRRLHNKLEAKN